MHGGDIYNNDVDIDFSVNLNPYHMMCLKGLVNGPTAEYVASGYREAVRRGLEGADHYPEADQGSLREVLSEAEGVEAGSIYAGCGASQLLMSAVQSISPRKVLIPRPCFSGYEHALKAVKKCHVMEYGLKEEDDFALTEEFADKLTDDLDLIIVADPDNPAGKNIDEKVLACLLNRAQDLDIWVILDESFLMISDKYRYLSGLEGGPGMRTAHMTDEYKKLYMVRSYTKSFALPGIRMGHIISRPENIERVIKELPEWNLPALSEAVMKRCALLSKDPSYYSASLDMIRRERSFMEEGLARMGFRVIKGNSLFLLFNGPAGLYEWLLAQKILIRRCEDMIKGHEGRAWYRIGIRSREDNERLIDEIGKFPARGE